MAVRWSRPRQVALSVGLAGVLAVEACALALAEVLDYRDELREALAALPVDRPVAVPARDLSPGHAIAPADLVIRGMPPALVPDQALTSPEALIGRVAVERLAAGELVRAERLAPEGRGAGLRALLPEGWRAESLDLRGPELVSGFVEAGARVDVVTTFVDAVGGAPPQTRTLLQRVPVLSVEERFDPDRIEGQQASDRVTLALTPADAERLTHAIHSGRIRLVLRSALDLDLADPPGATNATLTAR
jgi:pilus assembly protein CpaB